MLDDKALLKQFENHKRISESQWSTQHRAAKEDHSFVAGDTMYYSATVEDKGSKREVIFNKVKPYVDAVVGTMIQMRRKPQYQARIMDNMAMQEYSSYMNNLSDYARGTANMDFIETQQDREMLITGYGAIDTGISYEDNPDGEVVAECVRFDDVFGDPLAKETNMLDGRWVFRRKPFSKTEAEERFQDVPIEDFDAYSGMRSDAVYYPDGGEYDKIQPEGGEELDLVQVFYYQWWELMPYYRAENPISQIEDPAVREEFGLMMQNIQEVRYEASDAEEQEDLFTFKPDATYLSLTPTQHTDLKALCKEYGVSLVSIKQRRKCYYTALLTGKKVLRKFKSPAQDGFTIKFKTANYDPTNRIWYGMVRSLKNPAQYADKALTEILYTIASNSKGGVMYESSAVSDPRRFEQQWATTKAAIQVEDGALSGGKIQPKAQASLPTGYETVYQMADASMSEVSGISKEFLGTATNKQVAALLESQRINQVLATLAVYFDAISLYQLDHARMMVVYIRMLAENSQGRLIKIVGKTGAAKYEQLTDEKMVDEYDIDIGEAPSTPAQKEQTTQIMMAFADKVAVFGTNLYSLVVPYLPITQQDQQKLLEAMSPTQEQQQLAQKQAADTDAMNKVIMEGTQAKAKRDLAEAQYKLQSMGNLEADGAKSRAEAAKTLEDAHQTSLENNLLRKNPEIAFKGTVSA